MFSYWLGLFAKKNLRDVGDGNPGAANLWKALGYRYGAAGVVLDYLKGYLPLVFVMESNNLRGYQIILIALAPILGHAFSPFLQFKGGKAIAVTFGVWSALTGFQAAIVYAVTLALLQILSGIFNKGKTPSPTLDSYLTVLGLFVLPLYLFTVKYPFDYMWIWFGNLLIFLYKNKLFIRRN